MPTDPTKPKYQLRIDELDRYSWKAVIADLTVEPPSATSITAKSLDALMAKVLMAVCLRDKNLGVPEPPATPTAHALEEASNGHAPTILTPSRRLITPENP